MPGLDAPVVGVDACGIGFDVGLVAFDKYVYFVWCLQMSGLKQLNFCDRSKNNNNPTNRSFSVSYNTT